MKTNNHSFISVSLKTAMIAVAVVVMATQVSVLVATKTLAAENSEREVQSIVQKTNTELDRRIAATKASGQAIDDNKNISPDVKKQAKDGNKSTMDSLNTLKAQMSNISTLAGAKQQATATDAEYNKFKTSNAQAAATEDLDSQQGVQKKLEGLAGDLQTQITSAESSGKDTGSAQDQLDGIMNLIKAIAAIIASVVALILSLAAGDFGAALKILETIMGQLGITLNMSFDISGGIEGLAGSVAGLQ
jgi:hypothetical protein